MRSSERNKLLTALVLLGVFVAGAVSGAAALHLLAPEVATARDAAARGADADLREGDAERRRDPDRGGFAISRLLHEELELTEAQESRVDSILDRREERAHELFGEMRSVMRSQFDSTVSEVRDVLTAEQAERFGRLLTEMRERWEKERGDHDRKASPGADGR